MMLVSQRYGKGLLSLAMAYGLSVAACGRSHSSHDDKHEDPAAGYDMSKASQLQLGQEGSFDGEAVSANPLFPHNPMAYGYVTAARIKVERELDLRIVASTIAATGCDGETALNFDLTRDDNLQKLSTLTRDGFQSVAVKDFPGKVAVGNYYLWILASSDKACRLSGSVVLDVAKS